MGAADRGRQTRSESGTSGRVTRGPATSHRRAGARLASVVAVVRCLALPGTGAAPDAAGELLRETRSGAGGALRVDGGRPAGSEGGVISWTEGRCRTCGRDTFVNRAWERAVRERGAGEDDVIDCLSKYVGAYQQEVARLDGSPDGAIVDLLYLESLPDHQLVVELAGRLFLLTVSRIPDGEAAVLHLRSLHDAEQQEAALARGEYFPAAVTHAIRALAEKGLLP